MKIAGIYKLQWGTGNYYIGLSLNLNTRFAGHLSYLRKETGGWSLLSENV